MDDFREIERDRDDRLADEAGEASSAAASCQGECECGAGLPTPEQRERYGSTWHSPWCPVGQRERTATRSGFSERPLPTTESDRG